jgi:uncharacterized protein (TIGR03083 family)
MASVKVADYIDAITEHGEAFVAQAERLGLTAVVPSCPSWTVRDLVGHLGGAHRWAAACVSTPKGGPRIMPPDPPSHDLLSWYQSGLAALTYTLTTVDPTTDAWFFLSAPDARTFWARRQALETAIHRADADQAAATRVRFNPTLAADGMDELLRGFLCRPRSRLIADSSTSLRFDATDTGDRWQVDVESDGRTVVSGDAITGAAAATVRGAVSDLYLWAWNREPADEVEYNGDPAVETLWRGRACI